MATQSDFRSGDALILVDVQVDFCPGGALPIASGDEVVPVLNNLIAAAKDQSIPIYASRCWHPPGHISFVESGGLWPPHCLQDTSGADFHPGLAVPDTTVIVTKGVRLDQDQNSAFDQTGLADHLKKRGVQRLWVGGLAEDVCVVATALDARESGFEVVLVQEATRPVSARSGEAARRRMREAGVHLVSAR